MVKQHFIKKRSLKKSIGERISSRCPLQNVPRHRLKTVTASRDLPQSNVACASSTTPTLFDETVTKS